MPRFQPLVLATVVDPGGFPTRTGRPVGRWRPASPSFGDASIVSAVEFRNFLVRVLSSRASFHVDDDPAVVAGPPFVDFVHSPGCHGFMQSVGRKNVVQLNMSGRYVSGYRVIGDHFQRIGFQVFGFRIGLTPVWVSGSHVVHSQRGHVVHDRLGAGRKTAVIIQLVVE